VFNSYIVVCLNKRFVRVLGSYKPDSLRRFSILPNLFSSPSIYLALEHYVSDKPLERAMYRLPLGRISLLFHLGKHAFCFVVDTMRASW
jgi:hypothetical protein